MRPMRRTEAYTELSCVLSSRHSVSVRPPCPRSTLQRVSRLLRPGRHRQRSKPSSESSATREELSSEFGQYGGYTRLHGALASTAVCLADGSSDADARRRDAKQPGADASPQTATAATATADADADSANVVERRRQRGRAIGRCTSVATKLMLVILHANDPTVFAILRYNHR
ncbi:uncharacterized protein LOC116850866 [Odontomachus brunneus]|uniref:uncharacterized protein LOC116850866 n=1 Tax=Odontomachus brunneus TaxID=486640 RepID=UPI0013F27ACD|nr:uncharacterized protein LOC116850866 [Odontomachus brunneus]